MATIGFSKNPKLHVLENRLVDNENVNSKALNIDDPSIRLMHIIGGYFFNEPKFYGNEKEEDNPIINSAIEIAQSDNPEDLLIIARWAKEDLNIRTTPVILLAIASYYQDTKQYVRSYGRYIIQRPDDIKQLFAAYLHYYGHNGNGIREKGLPHCLTKTLRDSFLRFNDQSLLKYDSNIHPTFKDVLLMIRERQGIKKYLFEYLVNKKIIDCEEAEVIKNHKKLATYKEFNEEAKECAIKAHATWEILLSQFGNSKEIWEFLIYMGLLKYTALLKNLRNIENANIHKYYMDKICHKIYTEKNHRQFPFRFINARNHITNSSLKQAIDIALEKSIENIPALFGKTLILVDSSGSMDKKLSEKSEISYKLAASSVAAIIAKRCIHDVSICCFAEYFKYIDYSVLDPLVTMINKINSVDNIGCATYAFRPLMHIIQNRDYFDRIIILSDMNCYANYDVFTVFTECQIPILFAKYQQSVNRSVKLYSVNFSGHWQAQLDPQEKNCMLISGFNEKIINLIHDHENDMTIPKIELLREKYKLYG